MYDAEYILTTNESKILKALFNFLTKAGKITMGRAAQDEGIPVHYLLAYINDNNIQLISNEDKFEALRKVVLLMKEKDVGFPSG